MAIDLEQIEKERRIREIIREELQSLVKIDKYTFEKNIQILDARNFQFGRSTGTKFGTATDQLIGFYNTTPVNQPAGVADASGGSTVDGEARAAINSALAALRELGLIAT